MPLNSRYTGHEAFDVVRRPKVRLVVLADGFLGRDQLAELRGAATEDGGSDDLPAVVRIGSGGRQAGAGVHDFAGLPVLAAQVWAGAVEAMADAVSPETVADVLFTSGTTGRSKGALSAHRQTLAVAAAWAGEGLVSAEDRYYVVNPFFHAFGYKAGLVVCLLRGATVVTRPVFDLEDSLRLMADERISVLAAAPPVFQSLLDARAPEATKALLLAVTGATLVPVALLERIQGELRCPVVLTAYGLSEAVVATMCRAGDPPELVARTVGRPVAGFELRVVDPGTSADVAPGSEGEVLLRGSNVMLGYLDDPRATAEAIDDDGWLHTGDAGRLDESGYLVITDRIKDVVIVGGFNVYPAELERLTARTETPHSSPSRERM